MLVIIVIIGKKKTLIGINSSKSWNAGWKYTIAVTTLLYFVMISLANETNSR